MTTRFVPNDVGLREIARLPGVAATLADVGHQVIERAAAISPSHTFSATLDVLDVRPGSITVGTTWGIGHIIEWGSVNNPPYAPIRGAISALGLRTDEGGGDAGRELVEYTSKAGVVSHITAAQAANYRRGR